MEKLERISNVLEISVNKYDDVAQINCDDINIFEKFTNLYANFDEIVKKAEKEVEAIVKRYEGKTDKNEDVDLSEIRSYIGVHIEVSRKVMEEIDAVFGDGFTKKVYRENYELNPDFVPDEMALSELIESLIPIIEKAYRRRVQRNNSKYNAKKRGKHNKTKEQLIEEYKEKNGMNE